MAVIINGRDLTIEQVISVCRHHEKVELAPEAVEAVKKARAYVEKKVAEKAVVYGLTTGFGKIAQDFARFTRRARECGGRILRYVTDKRTSSNTVKRAKDKHMGN